MNIWYDIMKHKLLNPNEQNLEDYKLLLWTNINYSLGS